MKRVVLSALLCLCIPSIGAASALPSEPSISVRPVERSSTDIFEVLTEFIKAEQAYKAQDYAQSAARYRTVLLHDSGHIKARLGLGHAALHLGYEALASDIFTRFSDETLSPDDARSLALGQALSGLSKLSNQDGLTALQTALKGHPSAPRLWAALGDNYVAAKEYSHAASAYNKARDVGYSGAQYAYQYGLMNLAREHYADAAHQFKTAARLDPSQPDYDTHYRLALLLGGDYINALEQMPAKRAGYILGEAGRLAMARGEHELARLCLKKALEVSPSYNKKAAQNLAALKAHLP